MTYIKERSAEIKYPLAMETIDNEDINALCEWLKTYPRLTKGSLTLQFEEEWAGYIGTKYSVGVGSATHALHLSVKSLGIGPGDEVIVPNFTFAATANAVKYCSAEPVLTDVDLSTFNILPSEIQKNISEHTDYEVRS